MIFSDFLEALHVRHTRRYSDRRFATLTFKSLFGFSRLLQDYGVENAAWEVPRQGSVTKLPLPCLAQTKGGFVIVTSADSVSVRYVDDGKPREMATSDFEKEWTGVVLTAKAGDSAEEPLYARHVVLDFAARALTWIMLSAMVAVLVYLYVSRGFSNSVAASVLIFVDLAGLVFTAMLMLKSVNVHTKAADRVCGILQHGGCDKILSMDASKFFGLFGWSEVGLGYFLVSTAALLLYPSYLPWLAWANLCCLPFTFWSIWYQRFRARHWCTLCVLTQCMLWCQFFCYLSGSFEPWSVSDADSMGDMLPLSLSTPYPWMLLCCYVAAVLLLNKFAESENNQGDK